MQHFESLYFGENGNLFGSFHTANTATRREAAVLICPPLFSEYYRCHFVMRKLAIELSAIGYDVMRFDYSGTGDSLDDLTENSISSTSSDVEQAREELVALSGAGRLYGVGIRFSTALLENQAEHFDGLVHWDPIWCGAEFFKQMKLANKLSLEKNRELTAQQAEDIGKRDFLSTGLSETLFEQVLSSLPSTELSSKSIVLSSDYTLDIDTGERVIIQTEVVSDWIAPSLATHYPHEVVNAITGILR